MKRRSIKTTFTLALLIMILAISTAGCGEQGASIRQVYRGLLSACGEYTVYLNIWYGISEEVDTTNFDPIGGYLYLYWIDENGQVCHGTPGEDAQLGPYQLYALTEVGDQAINDGSIIPDEQLEALQTIPFEGEEYTGTGLHFAQFASWKWRERETGYCYSVSSGFLHSIPEVVDIQGPFCIMPVKASAFPDCLGGGSGALGLPSGDIFGNSPSETEGCQVRVQPSALDMTLQERVDYCLSDSDQNE
jgi:hypothetical protein